MVTTSELDSNLVSRDQIFLWQITELNSYLYGVDVRDRLVKIRELENLAKQREYSQFWDSLIRLEESMLLASFDVDLYLTEEVKLGLNTYRPQYADYQDIRDPRKVEITPEIKTGIERQIVTHLGEHALNRNLFEGEYFFGEDGRMKNPFQERDEAFSLSLLRGVMNDAREYLKLKFGAEIEEIDLEFIDQNYELLVPMIFSKDFMETRLGLELAEYLGVRRFEDLAKNAKIGETLLMMSPYSRRRGTYYEYQFTNVGKIEEEDGVKKVKMIYGRTEGKTESYIKKFTELTGNGREGLSAIDVVQKPILLGFYDPESVLKEFDVVTDPEVIKLFDQAIERNIEEIRQLVDMMTDGKHDSKEVARIRKQIERKVVDSHKDLRRRLITLKIERGEIVPEYWDIFFDMIARGYNKAGLCGMTTAGFIQDSMGLENNSGMKYCKLCGIHYVGAKCPECNLTEMESSKRYKGLEQNGII